MPMRRIALLAVLDLASGAALAFACRLGEAPAFVVGMVAVVAPVCLAAHQVTKWKMDHPVDYAN